MTDDKTASVSLGRRQLTQLEGTGSAEACDRKRDQPYGAVMTYSPKVFIPLTRLCRDVCHYCTFAQTPSRLDQLFMPLDAVLSEVRRGRQAGCLEVLITLGEKPEYRYRQARDWLRSHGFDSTVDYIVSVCQAILDETGLLPHVNAGTLSTSELIKLRSVSASMGLMLESGASHLCEKGKAHYGSPDKRPFRRWLTLARAGRAHVPMTTGLLIGIGESRADRLRDLHGFARLHQRYGHIQEVIIQNFRAKADTLMASQPEPDVDDLVWTLRAARHILPAEISLQAPPNLSPDHLTSLIDAGINDWGGISPVTPDYVNPEAPWPSLDVLRDVTARCGKLLLPRLTVYPRYLQDPRWISPGVRRVALELADSDGLAREDDWRAGRSSSLPGGGSDARSAPSPRIRELIDACLSGEDVGIAGMTELFQARGVDHQLVCEAADALRAIQVGDEVTYVVNRNINYTNVCQYSCHFCAYSKGGGEVASGRAPYDIDAAELRRRVQEAAELGATEVCLQGGIHPAYTGETYLDIVSTVKAAAPGIHIHAFSPLEIQHGAQSLDMPVGDFLEALKRAGLSSLPGTAAEILDDGVRALLCPDKLTSEEWLDIMSEAHRVGLFSTATIMFGHIDAPRHWAQHWQQVAALQRKSRGFTECVPLPFVALGAPIYRRGESRPGPTWREALVMHAVLRLTLGHLIPNIQASWVKLGHEGALRALSVGANDLGGTLINESITRSAGAAHGQYWSPADITHRILALGRLPVCRRTNYEHLEGHPDWQDIACLQLIDAPAGKRAVAKAL